MSALIIAPGIHGMTNAEHHQVRALSNSGMKDLSVSPLRYWYHRINPAPKPDDEETAAMRMGSALHCAVFEPDAFQSRYACALGPDDYGVCLDTIDQITGWIKDKGELPIKKIGDRPAKKDDWIAQALKIMDRIGIEVPILQEEKRRFDAKNEHKAILHPDEWDRLAGMALALSEEPVLKPILANGKPEVSMIATDPETGVLLKARLDWTHPTTTLDLKTFTVKRGGSIEKAIIDAIWYERYHFQAVFYDMVRRLATGEDHDRTDFIFAFCESNQPHETKFISLRSKCGGTLNTFWEIARQEIRSMIRLYARCLDKYGDSPWRDPQEISTLADEDFGARLAYA